MEEQNFSSQRRQEILENLRKEREKRREEIESEDCEVNSQVTHSFRSETIARLVQERRNQDIMQLSKANLQDNLKEEMNFRNNALSFESSDLSSPQTWRFTDESEIIQSVEPEKPKKREIPNTKSKPYSARVKPNQHPSPTAANIPKNPAPTSKISPKSKNPGLSSTPNEESLPKNMPVRLKSKKSSDHNSKNSIQSAPSKIVKPLHSQTNSEKDLRRESFEKRIDELVKSKEVSIKHRELEKKKKDEEEMKKCSFTPQVTPYFTKHTITEKIEDRLMKLGQEHQKNREKVRFN